jgi:hypothetical protein
VRDAPGRAGLAAFASLLMPAEPFSTASVVQVDASWSPRPAAADADADVIVWGRSWLPSKSALPAVARYALARERALADLRRRPPEPYKVVAVHRLPPPVLGGVAARGRMREVALGGALVELTRGAPVRRVIDAAAHAAGAPGRLHRFRRGSGAAALARLRRPPGGDEVVLRVALAGGNGDPSVAADALQHLESHGVVGTPRLVGRGLSAGASWTVETVLEGRSPRRVDDEIAHKVARSVAGWPRAGTEPRAPAEDLRTIAEHFPQWAGFAHELTDRLAGPLATLEGVTRHGDLWAGNLVARRGRPIGVLDWDAWHPSGAPGADLVYLHVTEAWRRSRRALGEHWERRLWRRPEFADASGPYWHGLGRIPEPQVLDAIGIAAWAAQIATNLRRLPELAENERWVDNNPQRMIACVRRWG